MGIEIASPGQLAQLLRGQDVMGIRRLQASGLAQLDGGLAVNGPAQINNTDLAALVTAVPRMIDKQTLLAAAPTVTIPSTILIPRGFSLIRIRGSVRCSLATADTVALRFNGDNGTHYSWQNMQASATGVAGADQGATGSTSGPIAITAGTNGVFGYFTAEIMLYDSSDRNIPWISLSFDREAAVGAGSSRSNVLAGHWNPVALAPVTSITLLLTGGSNFQAGCTFITELVP